MRPQIAGADLPDTNEGGGGNAQLGALIGGTPTFDAVILTFGFVSTASTIFFKYTFACAEYPNFVGQFNDVFGFFVNGTNQATLPGTSTLVSINNVNVTTNSHFFNKYNGSGDALPYGGETQVLTLSAPVTAGAVNTMVDRRGRRSRPCSRFRRVYPSRLLEHHSPAISGPSATFILLGADRSRERGRVQWRFVASAPTPENGNLRVRTLFGVCPPSQVEEHCHPIDNHGGHYIV